MKCCTLLLLAFIFPCITHAQNLVPNPGFENYTQCPQNLSTIAYTPAYNTFTTVAGWISPLSYTTPDYFNSCAAGIAGVPDNIFGHKMPHTGNGYAGIIALQADYNNNTLVDDYREYVECKLLQPLQAGQQYCISFYISTSIPNGNPPYNYICLNKIGLNLSNTEVLSASAHTLNLRYSVSNPLTSYQKDTTDWIKISGVYTAAGGEQWLTVGYFDTIPAFSQVYPSVHNAALGVESYLYIDDVSLYNINFADTEQNVHDTVLCDSLAATLSATSGATTYLWNTNAAAPTIYITDTGTYWCVSHHNDCTTIIDTFHIHYIPFELLTLGNDSVNCNNAPITIGANHIYDSYLWNTGQATDSITADSSGLYILTVEDGCNRVQTDSINIHIQPPTPTPHASDTFICQYAPQPIINVTGENIKWYYSLYAPLGTNVQPQLYTADTNSYTFYVSQTIGACESPKVPVHIVVWYKPQSQQLSQRTICDKDTLQLGNMYGNVHYEWNTGDTGCCISCTKAGIYIVTISNECGVAVDSTNLDVSSCNTCIAVPNAFTPNNDGINDLLQPIIYCPVAHYSFKIFNRWGQVVFHTQNQGLGWDGSKQGTPVPEGVYVYLLEYTSGTTGKYHQITGNIIVIR